MRASFKYLSNQIELSDEYISSVIIENKRLYRNVLLSFENNNSEEYFSFSKNFCAFDFSKKCLFISNPINVDLNNKKLSSKINAILEQDANNNCPIEIGEIKSIIIRFAEQLINYTDFDFSFDDDITAGDIIKLLNFTLVTNSNTPLDNLVSFIVNMSKYLKIELFIIPNLGLFFNKEELNLLFETLLINHIVLLTIDCFELPSVDNKITHIVDNDLCEIDNIQY